MPIAAIIITGALLFYSVGVWSEKLSSRLKPWHLVFFILGFICDTLGTSMMFNYASLSAVHPMPVHKITGFLAIILMLIHVVWAIIVLLKNDDKQLRQFHHLSFIVWIIWLLPYISGIFLAMNASIH